MPRRLWSRRDFFRRLGPAAMLLPALYGRRARGADAAAPTRALFIFNGTGTIEESFWPSGDESNFTFPKGSILEPLAPLRSHLLAIRNLKRTLRGNGDYGQHERNMADVFTGDGTLNPGNEYGGGGWAKSPSVDQVIANTVPQPTRFPTLQFGAMPGSRIQMRRCCFTGSNQPIEPMSDPVATFQRLFGDFSASQAEKAAKFAAKKSVLDVLSGQLSQVRAHLSQADFLKVDGHLDALRGLERSLQPGGTAAACTVPTPSGAMDLNANDNFPAIVKAQSDIMVRAVVCDLTRIAVMQFSHAQCLKYFTWLGINREHHEMTHNNSPEDRVARTQIYRWYAGQIGAIAQALKDIPEGKGSMLDNTVILWSNESGNNGQAHLPEGTPTVLLGGGGGYFRPGRYLANSDMRFYSKQVLLSVCHAMGATGLTHLGDADYGDPGPMTTLT